MQTNTPDPVKDFRDTLDRLLSRAEAFLAERLGRSFSWPTPTGDALVLAAALGYDVTPKSIDAAIQRERISRPEKRGREFVWTRRRLLDLLMDHERRRCWIPGAELHRHKMTCYEVAVAQQRLREAWAPFLAGADARPDYAGMAPKSLLVEAVDAETVELRRWAVYCLRRSLGLVTDPEDVLVAEALRLLPEGDDAGQRGELAAVVLRWMNSLGVQSESTVAAMATHDPTPIEPSARERELAQQSPDELLDQLERHDLSRNVRRELVGALMVSAGQRSSAEAQAHAGELLSLGDPLIDGDADALESARQWITNHLLIGKTQEN